MSEKTIQQNIRLACGSMPGVRLFRNNVGQAKTDDGRLIQFGLCKGSSDLIGYVSTEITPDMIGQRVAIFTAIEVKAASGKVSDIQQAFIDRVQFDGGNAGVARSVSDGVDLCR